jgi:hypothetical protein
MRYDPIRPPQLSFGGKGVYGGKKGGYGFEKGGYGRFGGKKGGYGRVEGRAAGDILRNLITTLNTLLAQLLHHEQQAF